jgi:hypothetical protein
MPGPAIAAVAGGLGSALIGARASSKAAEAQSDASDGQLRLQADMFNRMDDLQGHLFRNQSADTYKTRGNQLGSANQARRQAVNAARGLRNRGDALQSATRQRNTNALRDATQLGMRDFNGNLRQNLGDANQTFRRGMDTAEDVRDRSIATSRDLMQRNIQDFRGTEADNISDLRSANRNNLSRFSQEMEGGTDRLNRTQQQNIGTLNAAQDASLAAFQPALGLGNNALKAYASNLGLGKGPKGYRGMELTDAARFNMEQGREITEGGAAGSGGLYSGATMAALEKLRGGIAAQDRGNQMAELMGLGQVGQNAANSMAGIRGNYSDAITGERSQATSGINALRQGYTGMIGDQRNLTAAQINAQRNLSDQGVTGQRDRFGDRFNSVQDAYGSRALTLGQNRQNSATDARNFATVGRNDLRQWQTGNQMNVNNAFNQGSYGIGQDYANAFTNATDTQAGRNIAIQGDWLSNLGAARSNRANLYGTAATNYANGASNALANRGAAQASSSMGFANSMLGGIQNGMGLYGMMGGNFGQPQTGDATGGGFTGGGFGNWLRGLFS